MPDFTILSEESFRQEDVEIVYVAGTRNAMPMDHVTETLIEQSWSANLREAEKRQANIFNGLLFRLKNLAVTNGKLVLGLGDTNYKEYVATRAKSFYRGRKHHVLANPLAICIAIGTAEGKIIIEKRTKVDVYPGSIT